MTRIIERRVKNIVDTIFFTPDVCASGRLQTSCDAAIGTMGSRCKCRDQIFAPAAFLRGSMDRCCVMLYTPPRRACTCNAARVDNIASHCQYALLCATHSASVSAPYNSGFSRKKQSFALLRKTPRVSGWSVQQRCC